MSSDKVPFSWEDPFLLTEQLTEEERLVESSARDFAQDKLMSRVLMANRDETFDREIMNEFGKLKKEFEKFSGSTEDLMKKVDALQKSVNEYSTRERQMERAIDSMDKLDS